MISYEFFVNYLLETEEWIDVKHKSAELLTGGTFIDELRSAIDDTDCGPGIIRKILGGRSITRDIEDATQIRQIVWPALLGVAKREMKEIKEDSEYDQSLKNHFENIGISIKSIPGFLINSNFQRLFLLRISRKFFFLH